MSDPVACECGGTVFDVTYQQFVSARVHFDGHAPHVDGSVTVDPQFNSDWIVAVGCAACGVVYQPNQGYWTDKDNNDLPTPDKHRLYAIAELVNDTLYHAAAVEWAETT